ncbi:MAG: hypothetical protein O3C61_04330 [Proteobacteria bacterium]|nr:hypothetical protein [Pseudomonadota bacterium]
MIINDFSAIVLADGSDAVRAGKQEQFISCRIDFTKNSERLKRLPYLKDSSKLVHEVH